MRRSLINSACLAVATAVGAIGATTAQAAQSGRVTGSVTAVGAGQFTIQTPGKAVGVINAMTTAATRIQQDDYPYVWGGGHGEAGVASKGERGPGYNGKRIGFDCSGAVAAVLVAGGLWPEGESVPNDANVIRYLLQKKLIAPGAGTGPTEVTLYDNPGVHIFMNIDGRFWGTSDGGSGGDAKGGAGWLDDGAWDVTQHQFRRYHVVPAALKAKTTAGYSLTFDLGPQTALLPGLATGAKVSVAYSTSGLGTMIANTVSYPGEANTSGVVTAITPGGTSFSIQDTSGASLTFNVAAGSTIAQQLAAGQITLGSTVTINYVTGSTTTTAPPTVPGAPPTTLPATNLTAIAVVVTAPPAGGVGLTTTTPTGTTTTPTTPTPTTTTPGLVP